MDAGEGCIPVSDRFDLAALVARGVSIAGNGLTLGTILHWHSQHLEPCLVVCPDVTCSWNYSIYRSL
jgi:hypothetical protein